VLRRRGASLEELRYEDGRRTCFVPEAGKAEDLRKTGGRAAERNVTLLFISVKRRLQQERSARMGIVAVHRVGFLLFRRSARSGRSIRQRSENTTNRAAETGI
jgi:hypothetical protein